MTDFIPFPQKAKGIDKTTWRSANTLWSAQLTTLLKSPESEYSSQMIHNSSLYQLVTRVLDTQIDQQPIHANVSRCVFFIYVRAATLPSSFSSPLLSSSHLARFAAIYGADNSIAVRLVFRQLLSDSVFYKTVQESMASIVNGAVHLPDLLATHSTPDLKKAYMITRLLDALVLATLDVKGIVQRDLESTLLECYQSIVPVYAALDKSLLQIEPLYYYLKLHLVFTFNHLMDHHFFQPLGFTTNTKPPLDFIPCEAMSEKEGPMNRLSEHLLELMEKSNLEQLKSAFEDAPLIMDWEVTFHIANKLDIMNRAYWNGQDERVEFLKMSMEQVTDMNQGSIPWNTLHSDRRSLIKKTVKNRSSDIVEDKKIYIENRIIQVQDVFPDLGEGFIEACLEENQHDPERVVLQLISEDLPPTLAALDRTMSRHTFKSLVPINSSIVMKREEEREDVLNSRHNIFDNDAFDMLRHSVNQSKVHLGKKSHGTVQHIMEDKSFIESEKANILQRVFNMYEDDYDDTYDDIHETEGAVDLGALEEECKIDTVKLKKEKETDPGILHESDLVHALMKDPECFSRSPAVRKSAKRANMRQKLQMTDEQLEGWAIMFNRNPRKQHILDKYALFDGKQAEVSSQISETQKQTRKDNRPPPTEEKDRSYKNQNKSRFGNHNRKKMYDKKISKAGGAPSND
ncbi:hypothetical protein BDF14DRAFT_1880421 [Spinellus fusiger]|nr:hypothetical protein BDF14DRAFT_1880421 [Spinellus fusiger]